MVSNCNDEVLSGARSNTTPRSWSLTLMLATPASGVNTKCLVRFTLLGGWSSGWAALRSDSTGRRGWWYVGSRDIRRRVTAALPESRAQGMLLAARRNAPCRGRARQRRKAAGGEKPRSERGAICAACRPASVAPEGRGETAAIPGNLER